VTKGDERDRPGVAQWAVAEVLDDGVQAGGHPGHLALRQPVDAEDLDELVHPPGGDAGEGAVRDDGDQRGL